MQFAQLKLIFVLEINGAKYPLVFVEALDVPQGRRTELDQDLQLCRLRPRRNPHRCLFLPAQAIVRGALIMEDPAAKDVRSAVGREDKLVIDTIDTDMFLRIRENFPTWAS